MQFLRIVTPKQIYILFHVFEKGSLFPSRFQKGLLKVICSCTCTILVYIMKHVRRVISCITWTLVSGFKDTPRIHVRNTSESDTHHTLGCLASLFPAFVERWIMTLPMISSTHHNNVDIDFFFFRD